MSKSREHQMIAQLSGQFVTLPEGFSVAARELRGYSKALEQNSSKVLGIIQRRLVEASNQKQPPFSLSDKNRKIEVCYDCVFAVTGITRVEIRGKSRVLEVAFARNLFRYLVRANIYPRSTKKMGIMLGCHHTTILNSLWRIEGNSLYERFIDAAQKLFDAKTS